MPEYARQVFHCSLTKYLCDEIEQIQKRGLHIIYPELSYADAIVQADLPSLVNRTYSLCSKLFDSIVNNNSHKSMNLLPPKAISYNSRLRRKGSFGYQTLRPIVPEILLFLAMLIDTIINLPKGTSLIHLRIVNQ